METEKKKNYLRKCLGVIFLALGIFGLSNFVVGILLVVYGKEFVSDKGLILLPIFFIVSVIILLVADKLLHRKQWAQMREQKKPYDRE